MVVQENEGVPGYREGPGNGRGRRPFVSVQSRYEMSLGRRRGANHRDTARDIILGTAPSGKGPRTPKGGIANYNKSEYPTRRPVVQPPPPTPKVDTSAINSLQRDIDRLQRQNKELLDHEKSARKRLEENQESLNRKISRGASAKEVDEIKKYINSYEKEIGGYGSEIKKLRGHIDKQNSELARLQKDLASRPQLDPNKIAQATSQIDGRVKDLQGQLSGLKQAMDSNYREIDTYAKNLNRIQDHLRDQEKSKNEGLNSLARKIDSDKAKLQDDNKRLAERVNATTTEVTKAVQDSNAKMRDELNARTHHVDAAIKAQADSQAAFERELLKRWEEQIGAQQKQIEADRAKYKERFQKVNEALAALEHHLELGNKKIDKIVNAEIQSRKLHEKGLLQKVSTVEDKLNGYISGINKSIDDVKAGKENVKMPNLDVDALRREMEAIAADKNKLSMEGLLMLEEKISGMQSGFTRDRREVADRIATMNESTAGTSKTTEEKHDTLRTQMNKLDMLHDDMEKAQERIRDKVERQIPQDLNELSAKADNIKHQLNTRIDKEEEERYLAIRELQEAFSKLQTASANGRISSGNERGNIANDSTRRDVDECKVAIKKLAESIATVKNVLDKKINQEIRQRESDVNTLNQRINANAHLYRDTNRDTSRTAD